jgi:SAM-dependent methyltransferase
MSMVRSLVRPMIPGPVRAAIGNRIALFKSRTSPTKPPLEYGDIHANYAWSFVDVPQPKVLVVGANRGADCERFIKLGAGEVHGLDVVEDVGADFPHPKAIYHCASIEQSGLDSSSFDLVFATATMEHVRDIEAGFAEMLRLTRSGGAVVSFAAPLWNSPYGHHMACFHGHPWIHLTHSRDEIIAYALQHGINGERGHSIDAIVDYMLDGRFFNKRPATDYTDAIISLRDVEVIRNGLDLNDPEFLSHPLAAIARKNGFSDQELLATTHVFAGRKKYPAHLNYA